MYRFLLNCVVRGVIAALLLGSGEFRSEAAPFTSLYVFGDSLSDVGNISQATAGTVPGQHYWNGRFSNGSVYSELLATGLGLPALTRSTAGGNDFAYGGARTAGTGGFEGLFIRDVDEQVSQFLSSRTANASALFLIFAGANDLNGGQTNVSVPVNSLATSINRLVTAGARQFAVFNLPPLGSTPQHNGSATTRNQYNARTGQFNSALATMVQNIEANNPAVSIHTLDVYALFNRVLAEPTAFGLVNVTSPAAPGLDPGDASYNTSQVAANANQYLFWDTLHPTAAGHALLAQRALDLFRLPGDFNRDELVDAADYVTWRNGLNTAYVPYDYEVLRAHFGETSTSDGATIDASVAAVAEPTMSGALALGLLVGGLCFRRIQRGVCQP